MITVDQVVFVSKLRALLNTFTASLRNGGPVVTPSPSQISQISALSWESSVLSWVSGVILLLGALGLVLVALRVYKEGLIRFLDAAESLVNQNSARLKKLAVITMVLLIVLGVALVSACYLIVYYYVSGGVSVPAEPVSDLTFIFFRVGFASLVFGVFLAIAYFFRNSLK